MAEKPPKTFTQILKQFSSTEKGKATRAANKHKKKK